MKHAFRIFLCMSLAIGIGYYVFAPSRALAQDTQADTAAAGADASAEAPPDFSDLPPLEEIQQVEQKEAAPIVAEPVKAEPGKPLPPEDLGIPITIPILGTFKLLPYVDESTTPPQSGGKIKFADASKKITMGPLIINDGEITLVGGMLGITGKATLFGQEARFGLLKAEFGGNQRTIKKAVFGIRFGSKPTFDFAPGKTVRLDATELELQEGKKPVIVAVTTLFGMPMRLACVLNPQAVDAYIELPPNMPLAKVIPEASSLPPLSTGIITSARLQINNIWNKDKPQPLHAVLTGAVDLPPQAIAQAITAPEETTAPAEIGTQNTSSPDLPTASEAIQAQVAEQAGAPAAQEKPEEKKGGNFSLELMFVKAGVQGTLKGQKVIIPGFGTINDATISFNTIDAPAHFTLSGSMDIAVSDVGTLALTIESTITKKGIIFSGKVPKPFTYAGISLKDVTVAFDQKAKSITLQGAVLLPMLSNLTMQAQLLLLPDPKDKSKKTIEFHTKASSQELKPFSQVPGLEGFYIKDFTAGIDLIKTPQGTIKTFDLHGQFHFMGVALPAIVKFVENDKKEKGVYINAPLTKDKKLSDIIPVFKGPIFDGLLFEEAAFTACSIDYTDINPATQEKIDIKKGLSFLAKVPLKGTLDPVGKFLGSHDQTFTMTGTIDVNHPDKSELGFMLSQGYPQKDKVVSMGKTMVAITAQPSFELRTEILFRPDRSKPDMKCAGKFEFKPDKIDIDASFQGIWQEPFGLPKSMVSDLSLVVGMAYGSPGVPTQLGGGGKFKLGDFKADIYFSADAELKDIAIKGCIPEPMSLSDISKKILVTAFGLPTIAFRIPDPQMRDVTIEMAPHDVLIGSELVRQGLVLRGEFPFMGSTAYVDMMARPPSITGEGGFKIFGAVTPISLLGGLFTITRSSAEYGGRCFIPEKIQPCTAPSTTELVRAGQEFEKNRRTLFKKCQTLADQLQGIQVPGVDVTNFPRVDIELTAQRQNFLISGAVHLASIFTADTCTSIDKTGLHFIFESGMKTGNEVIMWNNKPLFYARVIGNSSGDLSSPQLTLSIDFMQNLQNYIKAKADEAFRVAQQQVIDGINTAQHEIDKIESVKADAKKKIEDARRQVADARKSLDAITKARNDARAAFTSAQQKVQSLQNEINALQREYNSLPDF